MRDRRRRREWLQRVGARLRELRVARDLSQEELADRVGVGTPYISDLERGVRNFGVDLLPFLAEALKCRIADVTEVGANEKDPADAGAKMRPWARRVSATILPQPGRIEARARVAFNFERLRLRAGLTREELGAKMGASGGLVEGVEDCTRPVSSEILHAAALALRASPAEFFRAIPATKRRLVMLKLKKVLQDVVLRQGKTMRKPAPKTSRAKRRTSRALKRR